MKKFILFITVASAFFLSTFAQEQQFVVKLVKKSNPETIRYLKEGKRVCLYDDSGTKTTGKLSFGGDSSLIVSGKVFAINDLTVVRGNSTGIVLVKIMGGLLAATGLVMVGSGGALIVDAFTDASSLAYIILLPLGIITSAMGIVTTLSGVTVAFINGKKYDLRDKWDISIVPASEISK